MQTLLIIIQPAAVTNATAVCQFATFYGVGQVIKRYCYLKEFLNSIKFLKCCTYFILNLNNIMPAQDLTF